MPQTLLCFTCSQFQHPLLYSYLVDKMVSSEGVEKDFNYPKVLFSIEFEIHFFVPLNISIVRGYILAHSGSRGSEFHGMWGSVERYNGELGVWQRKGIEATHSAGLGSYKAAKQ